MGIVVSQPTAAVAPEPPMLVMSPPEPPAALVPPVAPEPPVALVPPIAPLPSSPPPWPVTFAVPLHANAKSAQGAPRSRNRRRDSLVTSRSMRRALMSRPACSKRNSPGIRGFIAATNFPRERVASSGAQRTKDQSTRRVLSGQGLAQRLKQQKGARARQSARTSRLV